MKIVDIMRRKPTIILGLNEESQAQLELPADEFMATLTFQFEGDMVKHDYHKRDAYLSASVDGQEIYADNIEELQFLQDSDTHYRATIEQSTTAEQDAIIARPSSRAPQPSKMPLSRKYSMPSTLTA